MHSFDWVESALGMIVALGMTRMIASIVQIFVSRRQMRLDWIPLAWAVAIFFLMLQFSWNFVQLGDHVKVWNFFMFIILLGFVFTLFIAAVLILPSSESQADGDLSAWFALNGRWAMPFISLYAILSDPFYWYFLRTSPIGQPASIVAMIIPTVAFFAKSRTALSIVTILGCLAVSVSLIQMAIFQ